MENSKSTLLKKIIRGYYYIFYTLYKWYEEGPFIWASSWKAGMSIIVLEIWSAISIAGYYAIITKSAIELSIDMPIVYIPLAIIIGLNSYLFTYSEKWRRYIKEFDKLPKPINRKYKLITWIILLMIITNIIFCFYLISKINWNNYR